MLQYYLHIPEPDKLSDEEWAIKVGLLKKIREEEAKKSEALKGLS